MSFQQNVVQNINRVIGNLSFEDVEKFKYLLSTAVGQAVA